MINELFKDTEHRMHQTVEVLKHDLASIRTGRASLAIFDGITVAYYGTPTPLNQVAKLQVPDASLIIIQPWDPSLIGEIEKAIRTSDLGLNPSNDGKVVRVPIPPLTSERRQMLTKKVGGLGEEARNAVRNVRRDGNEAVKKLEKDKKISQDEEHRAYDRIQKMTDDHCKSIDDLVAHKDRELLEG
jgi:ribosome recycling factor